MVEPEQTETPRFVIDTKTVQPGITCKTWSRNLCNFDGVRYVSIPQDYDSQLDKLGDELLEINYYAAAELALMLCIGPSHNYLELGIVEDEDAIKLYQIYDKYWNDFEVQIHLKDRDYILSKPVSGAKAVLINNVGPA